MQGQGNIGKSIGMLVDMQAQPRQSTGMLIGM